MKCLSIPQFEENRFKVQKGREVHEKKESKKKQYLRKKLGVVDKQIDVDLYSKKFKIKGIVDEVVTLEDGSKAPLDYKFATFDEVVYKTYKTQMLLYSLMIEEMYNCEVKKAFLVYTRSRNLVKEIDVALKDIKKLETDIRASFKVVGGYFPKGTSSKARCIDCCYKNVCIK